MKTAKEVYAVIEARMGSTRLPGKMALDLYPGLPALGAVIERLSACKNVKGVVVATTEKDSDDRLLPIAKRFGAGCYRGSETDVLGRVVGAGTVAAAKALVLVTGDCSCISPSLIDEGVDFFFKNAYDLVSNCLEDSYPVGIDMQVAGFSALSRAHETACRAPYNSDSNNFEHTNYFIKSHPELFSSYRYPAPAKFNRPDIHLALDTEADLEVMRRIYGRLYPVNKLFDTGDIIKLLDDEPGILEPLKGRSINRTGIK
ncbi:MAG: hypothetical protein PHX64_02375 [Candidatus Omnitrophica bacterium]|nr:hypothetical protein [Candidatus Omnitrophota bacterium]MDD5310581.1 hypothetical protein [Candidatus Omnitrophota bacterium]MDD5545993.1 hypothetical protein [Candidatus Omnitrophota bacterium]